MTLEIVIFTLFITYTDIGMDFQVVHITSLIES